MTRSRIFGLTLAPGVKQRETADCETPARSATSYEVARPGSTAGAGVRRGGAVRRGGIATRTSAAVHRDLLAQRELVGGDPLVPDAAVHDVRVRDAQQEHRRARRRAEPAV